MESSRRDLLNDMAEHRSILKTNQNTHFSIIFQCLAISIESSRRDLLNDMARPILKITKIRTTPFWFHTQNRYSIVRNACFVFIVQYLFVRIIWLYVLFFTPRRKHYSVVDMFI